MTKEYAAFGTIGVLIASNLFGLLYSMIVLKTNIFKSFRIQSKEYKTGVFSSRMPLYIFNFIVLLLFAGSGTYFLFDLFATEDIEIAPGHGIKHPLNIKIKLPPNTYAQIESKSGLGAKGLLVYAGVIDENYRGIPHVVGAHIRHDLPPIVIKKNTKLAQMTMRPHHNRYYIVAVNRVDVDTDRGDGGFGSSGI
jgi:deoxyuridine 5'-triphosphate nucleotidohydrolase